MLIEKFKSELRKSDSKFKPNQFSDDEEERLISATPSGAGRVRDEKRVRLVSG